MSEARQMGKERKHESILATIRRILRTASVATGEAASVSGAAIGTAGCGAVVAVKQGDYHAHGMHHLDLTIRLETWEMLDAAAREAGTNPLHLAHWILDGLITMNPALRQRVIRTALNLQELEGRRTSDAMGRILSGPDTEREPQPIRENWPGQ